MVARFHKGQRLSAKEMNSLRANRTMSLGTIVTGNGILQRKLPRGVDSEIIWATISRSLLYANPEAVPPLPVEGYASYVLSIPTVPDWIVDEAVAVGMLKNNSSTKDTYICTTAHTTATMPTIAEHTNWDFLKPLPIAGFSTTPPDMRLFIPWYQVNDPVPLITQVISGITYYLFAQQLVRISNGGDSNSLMWDETLKKAKAVFI